jgi:hypothetical protein
MILKYFATLAMVVIALTYAASSLQFATRSQVLSGAAVDEALKFEFTFDADSRHTYEISPDQARFLEEHIAFRTEGAARVVTSKVEVTPETVSWTENRRTITAPGAAMTAQLRWDTPSDSADGARGLIYLDFPEIQGRATLSFHSGGYQKDHAGRYVVREMSTYRSASLLSIARFSFALAAGLPFGIVLHAIGFAFVVKGEKRSRLEALRLEGSVSHPAFYSSPVAEWAGWLLALGIGSFLPCMMAAFTVAAGFMSSTFQTIIYIMVAVIAAIALIIVYFIGRNVLTVQVSATGLSYARGRGELEWLHAAWREIRQVTPKSRTYRGNTTHWVEVEFNDNRKRLKISQSIGRYGDLRDLLMSAFAVEKQKRSPGR